MSSLLKTFGKGLLYLLVLPFLIIALAFSTVFAVCGFVILSLESIFLVFKKKTIFSDLPEDIEAKRILNAKAQGAASTVQQVDVQPQTVYPQPAPQPIYQQPTQTQIYQEPTIQEVHVQEPTFIEAPEVEEQPEIEIEQENPKPTFIEEEPEFENEIQEQPQEEVKMETIFDDNPQEDDVIEVVNNSQTNEIEAETNEESSNEEIQEEEEEIVILEPFSTHNMPKK